MTELLIFGVDGLNHDIVQHLIKQGEMPNLQKLQEKQGSTHGEYESYVCEGYETPHTGPMWTSIYTGLKPKEHGITSGGWNDGDSKFHVMNTVWDKLSDENISITLYGMPMTYKAKEVNGEMVSGFISTTLKSMWSNCVYPEDLGLEELMEHTSSYVAKVKTEGAKPGTDTENFWQTMQNSETQRMNIFQEQLDNDRDVVAYGTTLVDKIGHVAGITEESETALESYKLLDDLLGRLLETVEPEEVMVVSDHGFSEYSHDLEGYYLDTAGRELSDVFDVTPCILDTFNLGYKEEEYGPTEETQDLTKNEIEDVKKQLENMGYF